MHVSYFVGYYTIMSMSTRKGSSSTDTAGKSEKCGSCKKGVGTNDDGIQCGICCLWYHKKCHDMSNELYKFLTEFGDEVEWYCKVCKQGARTLAEMFIQMKKKVEMLESNIKKSNEDLSNDAHNFKETVIRNLDEIRSDLKAVDTTKNSYEDRIIKLENACNKIEVEQLTKAFINDGTWADVVKKHIDNRIEDVHGEVNVVQKQIENTRRMAESERERETRRKNVIIFNVPESDKPSNWKEQQEEDIKTACNIFSYVLEENFETSEIKRIIRLGRRTYESGQEIPCRPLLLEFTLGATKNYVMQHLNRLRKNEEFKGVVVSHDLSKLEREECKKLALEAKERESSDTSGEYIYRVRGLPGQLKIVKIKKRF